MQIPLELAAGLEGTVNPSYPTEDRLTIEEPHHVRHVFRVNSRSDREADAIGLVYVRNVGQGAALVREIRLWNADQRSGSRTGAIAIGAGQCEPISVALERATESDGLAEVRRSWSAPGSVLAEWALLDTSRLFFLEIRYDDVFASPGGYKLRAWFDYRNRGSWVASEQSGPSLTEST